MNIRFLLDSNIISETMKQTPNAKVMAKLLHHAGEMSTATVVWHELLFGLNRLPYSRKRQELERYFQEEVKAKLPFFLMTRQPQNGTLKKGRVWLNWVKLPLL